MNSCIGQTVICIALVFAVGWVIELITNRITNQSMRKIGSRRAK